MNNIQMLGFINNFITISKIIIGFEDILFSIKNQTDIIINTLPIIEQNCLIYGTLSYDKEEQVINQIIKNNKTNCRIILYGKHSADESVDKKQKQLIKLGFTQVYIYTGGLFEWLLLQDIYGTIEFPTTSVCKDILNYKPVSILSKVGES